MAVEIKSGQTYRSGMLSMKIEEISYVGSKPYRIWFTLPESGIMKDWDMDIDYDTFLEGLECGDVWLVEDIEGDKNELVDC